MDFTLMKDYMDRLTAWRMPGNNISVRVENKEVFTYQSGYSDVENQIPMRADHLLNIYSCSKVATVTAALQLYEKGFFLLDDPLYDFIPEYREMYIKTPEGELVKAKNPITLRQLFTMTSGLNYNMRNPSIAEAVKVTEGRADTVTVAKYLAKEPLSFEPGTRWLYSLSHDVLAAVVEVIAGKKFREYVQENIFDPLEMKESFYHNAHVQDRMAQQYRYVNSEETDIVKLQAAGGVGRDGHLMNVTKNVTAILGPEYDSGGAGITTSVSDYSKFVGALANDGVGWNGERILSAGTIELLRANQLNEQHMKDYNWSQLVGYGYGLGVRTLVDVAKSGTTGSIGEFGWGGAAGATVLVDPKNKLSIFYAHHMLNSHEEYYQPRLRNVLYTCLNK